MARFVSSPPESSGTLPQLDGVLVLNKPSGPSSTHCWRFLKKLGQKKIGHAGTLDPLASGVLIILLGQATKLSSHLLAGGRKVYRGVLKLGEETDTWDRHGKILAKKDFGHIEAHTIQAEVAAWKDLREQEVPPYSAAKHNGAPLYKLARKALPVPAKTKAIEISEAGILELGMPFVSFRVTCSSGSYIRSLAHSLGKRLGCGAVLYELVREYSHPYGLEYAVNPNELEENPALLRDRLLPLASALPDWPVIEVPPARAMALRNGMPIPNDEETWDHAILCEGSNPLALAKCVQKDGLPYWSIIRGLWKQSNEKE